MYAFKLFLSVFSPGFYPCIIKPQSNATDFISYDLFLVPFPFKNVHLKLLGFIFLQKHLFLIKILNITKTNFFTNNFNI